VEIGGLIEMAISLLNVVSAGMTLWLKEEIERGNYKMDYGHTQHKFRRQTQVGFRFRVRRNISQYFSFTLHIAG